MICPECNKQGVKSKVYIGTSSTTLMYCPPYYDEDGKLHHHDMNSTNTSYSCSNGHTWNVVSSGSCWCGWGKEE